MNGPSLLEEWRRKEGLTQTAAATRLELSQSAFCEYEKGKSVPRVDAAVRIARGTDGHVPVESWVDEPASPSSEEPAAE